MAKIIFRLGNKVPLTENMDVGEPLWDADRAALGINNGEQNPRFYPGINRDGSLKLNGSKVISPLSDNSYLQWQSNGFRIVYGDVEVLKLDQTRLNFSVPTNFSDGTSSSLPGIEIGNNLIKFTKDVAFLAGINLSSSDLAKGIIPTSWNPGDIFVAGSPHSWKSANDVLGATSLTNYIVDIENRENLSLNFYESRFFNKADDGTAFGSADLDTYIEYLQDISPIPVFVRASSATYTNKRGVRITADVNEPRLDYNPYTCASRGLLIEGPAQNLAPESSINAWVLQGVSKVNGSEASWNRKGLGNPIALYETGDASLHGAFRIVDLVDETTENCFSVYIEKAANSTRNTVYLTLENESGSSLFGSYFNLDGNSVGNEIILGVGDRRRSTIEKITNTIYRISISGVINAQGSDRATVKMRVGMAFGPNDSRSYQAIAGGGGFFVADVQLEKGYKPTSFIEARQNRSGDVFRIPTSVFGVDEKIGSLDMTILLDGSTVATTFLNLESNTIGNYHQIGTDGVTAYAPRMRTLVNGIATLSTTLSALMSDRKVAKLRFDYANYARTVAQFDDLIQYTDRGPNNPLSLTSLRIGSNQNGGGFINGWIQTLSYTDKIYDPKPITSTTIVVETGSGNGDGGGDFDNDGGLADGGDLDGGAF